MKKQLNQYIGGFKIHTPNLFNDTIPNTFSDQREYEILRIPLNLLRHYLLKIASRCAEIDDPILTKLMCDMTMYDEADPNSSDYNEELINAANENYKKFINERTN